MAVKTIVVGTDLGESGKRALQLAVLAAKATGATVWLVHASELGLEHHWPDLPLGVRSAAHALRERIRGRFENSLESLAAERKRCEDAGVVCQTSCEEGQPWETILQTAASVNADLIAVGDRRSGSVGLPERFLGSTAERVVRHASCSVVVSCGRLRDDYQDARIAVGTDFSSHGIEAVRWARNVVERTGGEVALVHVIPHPLLGTALQSEWPRVLDGLRSTAESRLQQLIKTEGLPENTAVHVLDGPIGRQLCNAAADLQADLVFMGTRGQGRLRGIMLGSSSQYCLRYSPVPVLAVRP